MRLVDGDKLLEHIKDLPTWWADAGGVYGESMKYPSGMFDCEDVVGSIENALTVDAVVVTRCKDCANSYEDAFGRVCAYGICVDCTVPDDFYCASSKPKEDTC